MENNSEPRRLAVWPSTSSVLHPLIADYLQNESKTLRKAKWRIINEVLAERYGVEVDFSDIIVRKPKD